MLHDWHNVLVACPGGIADVVDAEPAVRGLRTALPRSSITLLTSRAGRQVRSLLTGVDRVMVQHMLSSRWIQSLRAQQFDAALFLTAPGRSPYALAYACYLAGIPVRIGQSVEFGGGVLSCWNKSQHVSLDGYAAHLCLLRATGLNVPASRPLLPAAVQQKTRGLLRGLGFEPGHGYELAVQSWCPVTDSKHRVQCYLVPAADALRLNVHVVPAEVWQSPEQAMRRIPVAQAVALVPGAIRMVTNDPAWVRIAQALARPVAYRPTLATPMAVTAPREQEFACLD